MVLPDACPKGIILEMSTSLPNARIPDWFRIRLNANANLIDLKRMVRSKHLHTVCEEARCPNRHECWGTFRTATFMLLGNTCTRRCRFCSVVTGRPAVVDETEPDRVAESIREMGLRHAVITMVTRDDLPDGGSHTIARTVRAIRDMLPACTVEILCSDLQLNRDSVRTVVQSHPEIVGHNVETVRRLSPSVRPGSDYDRSIRFLAAVKELDPTTTTKSSTMVGLGETIEEVVAAMDDLRAVGVEVFNVGQYLRPNRDCLPVQRYWGLEEFVTVKEIALSKGFTHCESGPLVRSSYHAAEQFDAHRARS